MKSVAILFFALILSSTTGFAQLAGNVSLATAAATFAGENSGDLAGHHVAIIGDINDDSFNDFLISAPGWDESADKQNNGAVFLFYGSSAGFAGSIDLTQADAAFIGAPGNEASHDAFGLGDIDNDGNDDFAIAIKKYSLDVTGDAAPENRLGKVYIFFGHAGKFSGTISLENAEASLFGTFDKAEAAHVRGVGDLNNDGLDDFVVGAGFHSQVGIEAGKIYVFFGKPRNQWAPNMKMEETADASFLAEAAGDWAGHRVASVGDVNGDGLADFIAGANNADSNGLINNGQVYLILGKTNNWALDTPLSEADASWVGANKQGLGWNAASPGDVDDDGLDDILISYGKGKHFLLLGKNIDLAADQPVEAVADVIFSHAGAVVDDIGHDNHTLGDFNQDGIDDFAIGASTEADTLAGAGAGKSYIFWGRTTWPATMALADADVILTGENVGDAAGFSVTGGGDINNDGAPDILLGAVHNADNGLDAGKVYLFQGTAQGLTLIQPNGGEILAIGAATTVTWAPDPEVDFITLELSINDGLSWSTIAQNLPDNGFYQWIVPNSPSQNCRVRIKDAADGDPNDVSDAVFSIAIQPVIQVLSPNGGESFAAGSEQMVSWSSINHDENVKIEYSVDGGQTWDVISPDAPKTGSLVWIVPDRPSSDCFVRVTGSPTTVVYDAGDNPFTISGTAQIRARFEAEQATLAGGYVVEPRPETSNNNVARLTAANGTITYNFDLASAEYELFIRYLDEIDGVSTTVVNINGVKVAEWTYDETVQSDVFLYKSLGKHLLNAGDDIEVWSQRNGGEYARVDYLEVVRPDAPISYLTITSPNGGEEWPIDSSQPIVWRAENTSSFYNVRLSRNGGSTWEDLATNVGINPDQNGNITLVWQNVTGPMSGNCLVSVADADGAPADVSDAPFSITASITPIITVISPNGGENWLAGDVQTITWTSQNTSGAVKIELSRDAGSTWTSLTANTPDDGDFEWLATLPPSSTCFIRVSDVTNSASDASDAVFAIKGKPKITVVSPNGGETWILDTTEQITWTSEFVDGPVKIQLSRNNGTSWQTLADAAENSGLFNWLVESPDSMNCLVRIASQDESAADTSDAPFVIVPPSFLTITSPNGGEEWMIGSTHNITWASASTSGAVKIDISRDNGANWESITSNTLDNGTYAWTVASPAAVSCLIRVADVDGAPVDASDAPFAIIPAAEPKITVTSPNGGEKWEIYSLQTITWTMQGISSPVKIEFTRDNGSTWETLADNLVDSTLFPWQIPGPATNDALVRVSALDGSASDVSDAAFEISDMPHITLLSPVGGDKWQIGQEVTIAWTSVNTSGAVQIELSRDYTYSWETLVDSTADDGTFTWQVTGPASNDCFMHVNDINGLAFSGNDTTFAIVEPPSITLSSPNGGEVWRLGEQQQITWQSVNGDSVILVELSRDNGSSWEQLVVETANTGGWSWTVTEPVSDLCLVRVTDVLNFVSDTSDAVFKIDFPVSVARISDEVPTEFALQQNYPNPFNPETRIEYQLPVSAEVVLAIYNVTGAKIATLVHETQAPGVYMLTWNGQDDNGNQMPSGIYFCTMAADGFRATKRMLLMK